MNLFHCNPADPNVKLASIKAFKNRAVAIKQQGYQLLIIQDPEKQLASSPGTTNFKGARQWLNGTPIQNINLWKNRPDKSFLLDNTTTRD